MKKIIVTGCNGQLGRAINQQYAGSTEYELVNTDVEDLDITDVDAMREWKPEQAPHATVMNRAGNMPVLPVNAGIVNSAVPVNADMKIPMIATPIIA